MGHLARMIHAYRILVVRFEGKRRPVGRSRYDGRIISRLGLIYHLLQRSLNCVLPMECICGVHLILGTDRNNFP
jgi:hypothetical protein